MGAVSEGPMETGLDHKTWDERIFERIPSGVDESLIRENLKLTPTERLEKMTRVLAFIDEVKRANRDRLSQAP